MSVAMKNDRTANKNTSNAVIIITIVIICVALLAASFEILISVVNKQIIEANIDSMEELARHDQRCIRNSIELRYSNMEGAETRMSARDWQNTEELILALKDLLNNIPSVSKIIMLDENGTEYNSSGLVREDSYLMDICSEKCERFIARVNTTSYFRENRQETLFEAIPVDFDVCGNHMVWMICQFPISTLENELKIDSYDGSGFSSIIDAEGNYIINVASSHSFGTYDNFFTDLENAEFDGYADAEELRTTTTTDGAVSVTYTVDGQEYIMVITTIDYAGWYFITTVPVSVFAAQTNAILMIFTFLLIGLVAIVFIVALVIFRNKREQEKLRIAEAANRSKTEFLFNMSHDIRTPMNAILGYTDMGLRHSDSREQSVESFKKIRTAGGHLLNLINDILEMSRIEAGKLSLVNAPLDMRREIDGVVQMNRALATAKSIDFTADYDGIGNPYVYADALHINEVIINLISNAVKYTPDGGKVRYTASQTGNVNDDGTVVYRFEVSDNGIGMSDEFQTHLFEAFSREESSGVSKIEGAGLGLSIVKRIVDLAGGNIKVMSKLGEGSTFTVDIPFKVMTDDEIKAFEEAEKGSGDIPTAEKFKGKRVLLVEDNEMNREIATDILTEAGLVVDEAEDGEIAVKKVADNGIEHYDFVLMDVQMPVMNGYEATKAIRALQDGGKLPIIALSANAFEEDRQTSRAAGMNDHVAKPINVQELFATIAKYII